MEKLASEIIAEQIEIILDIEIALSKAKLMVEEILDNTEKEEDTRDINNALLFAAQRPLLNMRAQITYDYLIQIQDYIETIQKK